MAGLERIEQELRRRVAVEAELRERLQWVEQMPPANSREAAEATERAAQRSARQAQADAAGPVWKVDLLAVSESADAQCPPCIYTILGLAGAPPCSYSPEGAAPDAECVEASAMATPASGGGT